MATVTTSRVNLATNPGFAAVGTAATVNTNLVLNPSFETGVVGVTSATVITLGTTAYAPAVQSGTQALNIGIGPGATTFTYVMQEVDVTAGQWLAFSAYVRRSSGSAYAKQRIIFRSAVPADISTFDSAVFAGYGTTGGDQRIFSALAPTGAVKARLYFYFYDDAAGTVAPIDTSVWATDAWMACTSTDQPSAEGKVANYFDGSTIDPMGDFTNVWSGTAHASTSLQKCYPPTFFTASTGTGGAGYVRRSYDTPFTGLYCARMQWTKQGAAGSAGLLYTYGIGGAAGDVRSGTVWVRSSVAKNVAFLFRFRNVSTIAGSFQTPYVLLPANTWVELRVSGVVATTLYTNIQIYPLIDNTYTQALGDTFDMGGVVLENAPVAGAYFDGYSTTAVPPGYSPAAQWSYTWSGVAGGSTSIETLSVPLQDFQVQLPDGTIVGAGQPVGLKSIDGLRALPEIRGGDRPRGQQDGDHGGLSLLGERPVSFEFELYDPAGGVEAAIQSLSRNWQNIQDPDSVAMIVGDYLSQLATGGSKPVSALQVQLPGRAVPLFLLGRPTRFRAPVDSGYQYRNVKVSAEWTVVDGTLYDAGPVTTSCGLPSPVSGLTFPETPPFTFGTSAGGSVQLTNAGAYDAFPVFSVAGPCIRPVITKGSTGQFIRLNLNLLAGDVVVVDTQSKTVTYNGANRNNTVDTGSSFFTLPPGTSTVQFGSGDGASVIGRMTAYLMNTYSTI